MSEDQDLITVLNAKFAEVGKQLVHNGATMSRIEREMAGRISTNTKEIAAIKKVQWDQCTQANSEASNNSSKHKFYIFKPLTRSKG